MKILDFFTNSEHFLMKVTPYITTMLESIGILIIIYASIKTVINLIKSKMDFNNDEYKITLAKALAYALEFKLAGEIIKTVVIRTLNEFFVLGAVVILRVILTFVIEWEITKSNEEKKKMNH